MITSQSLPPGADAIPAMTTTAEREAYYLLARYATQPGSIVEMGAWLGASTAYIAAGIKDSGIARKLHVYDRWVWDPSHARKVKAWVKDHLGAGYRDGPMPDAATMFGTFKANLGPLLDLCEIHRGENSQVFWRSGPIALLVMDAPKRRREIARALGTFGPSIAAGCKMAWQDFAHFPSYEIVACLHRLSDWIAFDEGIAPGTTAVFTIKKPWPTSAVTEAAFSPSAWTHDEILSVWEVYARKLPEAMRARFRCGAALFLCDIGMPTEGRAVLRQILADSAPEVLPKWRYLAEHRSNLATRYAPLFEELPA